MRLGQILLVFIVLLGSVSAQELDVPSGEILLKISGKITNTNSDTGAEFDLDMLERLGVTSITTNTPWTDHPTVFEGVRLDVLLNYVGAESNSFRATAFDNYWFDVADIDFANYPIIVAYKRDGKYMTARNLGPLWIMFPFDDHPELLTEANKAACVWQLNALIVQ